MLRFKRQCKPVDNAAEDFKKFSHSVELFRLVYEAKKDVVDLLTDEGAQAKELSVNSVHYCLEEVTLPRVLTVKEFEQLEDKLMINVALGDAWLKFTGFENMEEKFVHKEEVWPSGIEDRVIFLRVKIGIIRWG